MPKSTKYVVAFIMFIVATVYTAIMAYVFSEYHLPIFTIGWFMLNLIPIGLNAGALYIVLHTLTHRD